MKFETMSAQLSKCMQGTYQFMSDGILTAVEDGRDYLQSPVDDLYSFYYTMRWAAVFHDREFADKDIPYGLQKLREKLLGTQMDRSTEITDDPSLLRPREYGLFVAKCQPLLRAWHSELRFLRVDWKVSQFELEEQETNAEPEIYIPMFLTFALRGVAILAELVHKYAKEMG